MGIIKKNEAGEFDLDNSYFINRVDLKHPEKEHTHKFIEFVYTLSGKGVHKIDDKEYHVKGGDMLLINYRRRHSVTPIENLSYVDIMLKPEYAYRKNTYFLYHGLQNEQIQGAACRN